MAKKLKYKESKSSEFLSIGAGAEKAGISYSRFRKALQRLGIEIVRSGWGVMVPVGAVATVKKAMSDGTIKRGRKKKAE